jgi:hypothetical protein
MYYCLRVVHCLCSTASEHMPNWVRNIYIYIYIYIYILCNITTAFISYMNGILCFMYLNLWLLPYSPKHICDYSVTVLLFPSWGKKPTQLAPVRNANLHPDIRANTRQDMYIVIHHHHRLSSVLLIMTKEYDSIRQFNEEQFNTEYLFFCPSM